MKDNLTTDIAEQAIVRRAQELNKSIEPETDLWSGIANRIKDLPQHEAEQASTNSWKSTWMPMSLAASLLITVGSLSFAGYTNYSVNQQLMSSTDKESTLTLIEKPYLIARANYLTDFATKDQQMSAEVRSVLKKNLKIIDDATQEIRNALKENPNDPFLTDALILTHQKGIQLLSQVTIQGQDSI
ncbi:MAG: hypothetical protein ACI9IA_001040 [Enterobacterales bacterium]|jgi:hypothetical protein